MKKVAAAFVALAMVAGAVVARRSLDTKAKVAERIPVLCAQSIEVACEAWRDAGANIDVASRDFTTLESSETSAYDLVIGPEVLTAPIMDGIAGVPRRLASSPLVVISQAASPVCPAGTIKCLGSLGSNTQWAVQRDGELGTDVQVALTAASVADPAFGDVLLSSRVEAARASTPGEVQNLGIPAAAVMVKVSVGPAVSLSIVNVVPAAQVTIAAFTRTGAPAAAARLPADPGLATALQADGWLVK